MKMERVRFVRGHMLFVHGVVPAPPHQIVDYRAVAIGYKEEATWFFVFERLGNTRGLEKHLTVKVHGGRTGMKIMMGGMYIEAVLD